MALLAYRLRYIKTPAPMDRNGAYINPGAKIMINIVSTKKHCSRQSILEAKVSVPGMGRLSLYKAVNKSTHK